MKLNSKLNFLKKKIKDIPNIQILELGVHKGNSTKFFLENCNHNNGHLISVDIINCSDVSDDPNWDFIHSNDDNFELINKKIKSPLDVIFIDSLHEASHVKKVFFNYYEFLKVGGICIIDDISWLPYSLNRKKTNAYIAETNFRIFNKVLDIYNMNTENFFLEFFFEGSGYAIITKKNEMKLTEDSKIILNNFNLKNLIKKIFLRKPIR
tara:strand:+ start:100 stop:726 length:627 start_codon:yes stop_codon:yes gene_type:complete